MWNTLAVAELVPSGAFVGRVAELDRLDSTLAALPERGAATVLVGGDAGMGKSRLLEEFGRRARDSGALVAVGTCTPAEGGGLPYGPIVGVLRDVARQLGPAAVAGVLDFAPEHGLVKTKLFETLLQTVGALAQRSPVVLVFEDLQWADSASIEVIDFLTRNLGDHPALLLASYRSDEVEGGGAPRRLLGELGRHHRVSQLELSGLDRTELAAMLAEIVGGSPDWTLIDAVLARSGGNPFFAEELAAARHAKALPVALRNVAMMRIERLSPQARHIAAVAATAGSSIHHRLLATAAQIDVAELDAALSEAVELKVLLADRDENSFRFRHALLREAVNESLLPGERIRLHRAVAQALTQHAELGAPGPGHAAMELADHWWDAGDWSEALRACAAAGDAAVAVIAMPQAHANYERALAAGDRIPTDSPAWLGIDRIDLLMKTADAAYLSGEILRSVDVAQDAINALDADTDPRRAAACYTLLFRNAWGVGDSRVAFDALDRAAALLPPDAPSAELAGVLAEQARRLMLTEQYDQAEAKAREAIATARAVDARVAEGHATNTLGVCIFERGETEQGLALVRRSLVIATELANPDQLDRAYANLIYVFNQAARLEEAAQLVFADNDGSDFMVGARLSSAGQDSAEALIRLGRLDEAEDLLQQIPERGSGSCAFGPYGVRTMLAVRRGRLDQATALLAMAEVASGGLDSIQANAWFHILRAELHLERGEPRAAIEEVERSLTVGVGTDDFVYTVEMHALGVRGIADDLDDARAMQRRIDLDKVQHQAIGVLEEVDALLAARKARGYVVFPRMLALVALCRAEASRVTGPDPDLWRAATASWDAAREPLAAAYCRWREAEYLLGARLDRRRAVESTQLAWQAAAEAGSPLLRARVERLAERARITLTAVEPTIASTTHSAADDLGLTPREIEVLAQLAKGRTDRQIAEELFISKKTASVHVSNLLRKLDASSRIEAAEIGQRALLV
jgi:DNA-binding CsgD family transcriptional regulator/tetratricopeptide (TPR) repeat protein